jgi:nucleoside-diphosphate-sugar epimerase
LTVNEFVKELYLGNSLEVYDPDTWRPYCHVQDFARIIELVITSEVNVVNGEIFNAGTNANNFTKRQIVEEVLAVLKTKSEIAFLDKGKDPRNYRVDFSKIREILGFEASYSVNLGIVEILGGLRSGSFREQKDQYGNYSLFNIV